MSTTLGRTSVLLVMLCTFCTGLFLIALWTVDDAITPTVPVLTVGTIDTAKPSAVSVFVFDVETGTEIASKDSEKILPIASITKLFTAVLFYTHTNLDATTSISWTDIATEGTAGRLNAFEEYTHRGLMYPSLLESSNDASVAMLRVDPELLPQMNEYAQSNGGVNTVFADTSGLSDKNVSTAYELSKLVLPIFKEQQHIFDITRLKQFIGPHTGWLNNNPLVHEEGYRGGKHGFTYSAQRTAVAFFDEKIEGDESRTIGYILLGSTDLKNDIALLRSEIQAKVSVQ